VEDFGVLVRRRREELGLSPSRVAELVGRAPGTVRAWEKGQAVPGDAGVLRSLAAVLALDEDVLFGLAGVHPAAERPAPTVEEALASLAAGDEPPPDTSGEPAPEPVSLPTTRGSSVPAAMGERAVRAATAASAALGVTGRRVGERAAAAAAGVRRLGSASAARSAGWRESGRRVGELAGRAGGALRTGRDRLLTPAAGGGSYLDDPAERELYRQRAVKTAVGVGVTVVVGVLAFRGLGRALESVWDALTAFL